MTGKAEPEIDRFTLIANLAYVAIAGVRTHTLALVVCRDRHPLTAQPRCRLRGFGSSSRDPTFDCEVPDDEFELLAACDPKIVFTARGYGDDPIPLIRGAVMRISGWAHEAHLIEGPLPNTPIGVRRFPAGTDIDAVWNALDRAVLEHWDAPYFPTTTMRPTAHVKDELSRRLGIRT